MINTNKFHQRPLADSRINQQITLADGRSLGYTEYGASDGKPVLYFHGYPGSRIGWPTFDPDDSAAKLRARIIAVDRPGYGLSDNKRGRTFLSWPDDVVELAMTIIEDWREAFRLGIGGTHQESALYARPWGSGCRRSPLKYTCGMGNKITMCRLRSDIMSLMPSRTAMPRSWKTRGTFPLYTTIWRRFLASWSIEAEWC